VVNEHVDGCLCDDIDPSDRPCLVCEAAEFLSQSSDETDDGTKKDGGTGG